MVIQFQKQLGLSLIELSLVLVIASAIMFMSVNQYYSYQRDSERQTVLYNVDILSQAAANYYWANCNQQFNPALNSYVPGTLNPANAFAPADGASLVLNIANDLIQPGYMPSQASLHPNSIVNSAGGGNGYVVQLNRKDIQKTMTVCADASCSTTTSQATGTLVTWQIQISVQLRDPTKAQVYKDALAADCVSQAGAGGSVTPCANAPNGANSYVVFLRAPALPVPSSRSALNQNEANLYMFNQQNNVYSITYLTSGNHSPEYQYFTCGGY